MKEQATHPTGREQDFALNETFFSTTDARGIIRSGNAVFERTSGYSLSELIGQPHNLIRHPDMPRSVFRMLWSEGKCGRPFAGYVKNHARNGNHYWVFAVIVPTPDGFLSVRIKPGSDLQPKVGALYQSMASAERTALAEGGTPAEAMDASEVVLTSALSSLGFPDYAAFSHHALIREIKTRDDALVSRKLRLFPEDLPGSEALRQCHRRGRLGYGNVCELFVLLDAFTAAAASFRSRRAAVQRVTHDFRLAALNAQVASHSLGAGGATVGTVAHFLDRYAGTLAGDVSDLSRSIDAAAQSAAEIASGLSAARIFLEMLLTFLAETGSTGMQRRGMTETLGFVLERSLHDGLDAIERFGGRMPHIENAHEMIRQDIIRLQVAQIAGLTEVARLPGAVDLQAMFTGLRSLIGDAQNELEQFSAVIAQIGQLQTKTAPLTKAVRELLGGLVAGSAPSLEDGSRPEVPGDTCVEVSS